MRVSMSSERTWRPRSGKASAYGFPKRAGEAGLEVVLLLVMRSDDDDHAYTIHEEAALQQAGQPTQQS
jgi:hypothetical protein